MQQSIKEYLNSKGVIYREGNGELVIKCLFNSCDENSRENEAHLYVNSLTGAFHCKKCDARGGFLDLKKHFNEGKRWNYQLGNKKDNQLKNDFSFKLVEKCHQSLPLKIKDYLIHERGISEESIKRFKIGYIEKYGREWISIPIPDEDGKFKFFKLRAVPWDSRSPKYIRYPKRVESELYGRDSLKENSDLLVICEGEFDRIVLESFGIPAVTSTAGANSFDKTWVNFFKHLDRIYVCFDNDEAGEKGAEKLLNVLKGELEDIELFQITLPEEVGEKGDITDFLVKMKRNPDDLFKKYAKKIITGNRIAKVKKPVKETSFSEWQKFIKEKFPELLFPAEVGLSVVTQLLISDITNPFSLVYVDSPSSGKTITINFFSDIDEITYVTDKFTPASFVSNAANVKKEKLKEIDLLPRLKHKMFLIRDLATLFSKREDDLNECLGILTRVLDGEGLCADTGVHGQRQYRGDYLFMILAGSTPIPPKVWKMMGNLGSRLFFLNMNTKEKNEIELANQLSSEAYKEKEKICRKITKNYLYTLWNRYPEGVNWDKTKDEKKYLIIIARCANLLAKLRGVVNVWKERSVEDGIEYNFTQPVIEKPDRISQLFYNLCRGHALAAGRDSINDTDIRLIIELMVDSSPITRACLFRVLLENNGEMKTREVEEALNCSKPTAHKEMETLKVLGVCSLQAESNGMPGEPEKILKLLPKFKWFLSDEFKALRGQEISEQKK